MPESSDILVSNLFKNTELNYNKKHAAVKLTTEFKDLFSRKKDNVR